MRVAYHFHADGYVAGGVTTARRELFEAILAAVPAQRRHIRIRLGDLVIHLYARGEDLPRLARALATESRRAWRTIEADSFIESTCTTNVVVAEVLGLILHDAQSLDEELEKLFGSVYLGALEVDVRVNAHWGLYEQGLPDRYRIAGTELRLLHTTDQLEADPQEADRQLWEDSRLFSRVCFEDIGVQTTLLDPYNSRDHVLRDAELEVLVGSQFGAVANETLLRIRDLDPRLNEALHAAFDAADRAETSEQLAQAALSCRRFLERLADRLFPPTTTERNGRKLGPAQYRNRLWAYAEDHLEGANLALLLSSLQDVGNRIDALDSCVQRGVHGNELAASELQRILVSMVGTVYDILTLAPPPLSHDLEPYGDHLRSILTDVLKHGNE